MWSLGDTRIRAARVRERASIGQIGRGAKPQSREAMQAHGGGGYPFRKTNTAWAYTPLQNFLNGVTFIYFASRGGG